MVPEMSTGRRNLLVSLGGASLAGLAGCTDLGGDSTEDDNDPAVVDTIEIANGQDVPRTFDVVLRSAERVLYWDSFELDASEGTEADVDLVDGPFGNGDEPLWLDVKAGYPDDGPDSAEGETVVTQPLGEEYGGCIYVVVFAPIAGGVLFRVDPADEIVSRDTRC
ncbi:hypothetical protein EXE46_02590 [Halorubrum sp. GN11_10-6_MGM]|uniref:hypothetical protein n=1 Tax=Halorubrum sp. GN11_10-6_MGM TaxID=2518112 RepID=UPI0010F4B06A|nr:hypothetical protein [Halorubrum sp. GN11_10-6_MGM]TKX75653.1 hypothetical protein EXE46_02590 [Halorubrum sp. GN11_10-6_MGM]